MFARWADIVLCHSRHTPNMDIKLLPFVSSGSQAGLAGLTMHSA
jgi:hypothetical protein